MNEGDQLVAKLNYTLDTLIDKYENISEKLDDLQGTSLHGSFFFLVSKIWSCLVSQPKKVYYNKIITYNLYG